MIELRVPTGTRLPDVCVKCGGGARTLRVLESVYGTVAVPLCATCDRRTSMRKPLAGVGVVLLIASIGALVAHAFVPVAFTGMLLACAVLLVSQMYGSILVLRGDRDGIVLGRVHPRALATVQRILGERAPDEGLPQLVGRRCAACNERITTSKEAASCAECGAAVHRECASEHAVGAHAPKDRAYR